MNFYKSAALASDHLDKHQGSVKGSLAAAGIKTANPGESKRILALVIETLKYRDALLQLLEKVPLLQLEKLTFPRKTPPRTPSSQSLVLVLLHDSLFSSRARIEASDKWAPKEAISRHQARLKAELVRIQIREGKHSKAESARTGTEGVERYIRWNPNTDSHRSGDWSLSASHAHSRTKGFERSDKAVYPVPKNSYFDDPHLGKEVLVFSGQTGWWIGDGWYEAGAIISQDKASCFPARVLMHGWTEDEGECIDATAAPGNKTSYVSALMGDKGKSYAFERSQGRFKTLEKMSATANCRNVKPTCGDFTETDPQGEEYSKVTRILLDPSCSGSGIVNRSDYLVDDEKDETDAKAERSEKLAAFQSQMILHAFKFAAATRVVYSTCSIHPEEDEQVVMKALNSPTAKTYGWSLAPRRQVLPQWERRGRPEEMGGKNALAEGVIRCMAGEDKTNGFFVACFVKGTDAEEEREEGTGQSKKRQRDEMQSDGAVEVDREAEGAMVEGQEAEGGPVSNAEEKEAKALTDAQRERKKRKKQAQKNRRQGA